MGRAVPNRSVSVSLLAADPGDNTLVTVPGTVRFRFVYGHVTLLSAVANLAAIRFEVETAPGSGSYSIVQKPQTAANDVLSRQVPFSFMVQGGCRYRYVKGALVGVTETLSAYSYTDL